MYWLETAGNDVSFNLSNLCNVKVFCNCPCLYLHKNSLTKFLPLLCFMVMYEFGFNVLRLNIGKMVWHIFTHVRWIFHFCKTGWPLHPLWILSQMLQWKYGNWHHTKLKTQGKLFTVVTYLFNFKWYSYTNF